FEGVHLHGHFGGRDQTRHEHEVPARQLGAIAQIQILGECIVLPPASVVYCDAAPYAGGTVEVEEKPAAIAAAMFENEMAVEQNRLNFREQRVILVDVTPACLHHPDFRIAEMR